MAKKDDSNGRWVTIGAVEGEDGKRHGGSPVFIVNGRITKGAAGQTGRVLANLKAEPELGSHRQQLHASREHEKALWHKRAREAGVNPSDLDTLAHEMLVHDKMHVEDRRRMLADARKKFRFFGYNPEAITTNLRRKGEFELPHLDQVAEELRVEHPEQFLGHDLDLYDRLVDLLAEGIPQPMSTEQAYATALEHLQEYGGGGSEISGEPLFSDEQDDFVPFSRTGKRDAMNASWNRLSPRELQRRSDRVRRYSRDMGASPFDNDAFNAAEALDTATRGAEPSELDRAIDEARQAVKDGRQTESAAVEGLMNRFGSGADSNAAKLLSLAIRRSLQSGRPVAAHFAELRQGQADVPDEAEREALRMQRDAEAIRYSRQHGRPQPEQFRYTKSEINEGAKLASRRGIPFTQAVEMLRRGGR